MTYTEHVLPSNVGVLSVDRERDIALDAHGLWPYIQPRARRALEHVDVHINN